MSHVNQPESIRAQPSWRVVTLVGLSWLGGFAALGVLLSLLAEVGLALQLWALAIGACGSAAHTTLLQFRPFRQLQAAQVWAVWLAAMSLLFLLILAFHLLAPQSQGHSFASFGLSTLLYAAFPVALASFLATLLVQRAEA